MRFIMPRIFVNCEFWKWNKDLRIYVSTFGHIKDAHKHNVPVRLKEDGYFVARVNGHWYPIHRLVLLTWRPLPVDGEPMTVDHLDSNRRNNRLDNLEWCTRKVNQHRADKILITNKQVKIDNGDIKPDPKLLEEDQCKTRKQIATQNKARIKEEAAELRELAKNGLSKVTYEELEVIFGITRNGAVFTEKSAEKLRKLYIDGYIVLFNGNGYSNPITTTEIRKIISSYAPYEYILDKLLHRGMAGGKFGGWSKIRLYWTDAKWLDAMIPEFDEEANG